MVLQDADASTWSADKTDAPLESCLGVRSRHSLHDHNLLITDTDWWQHSLVFIFHVNV